MLLKRYVTAAYPLLCVSLAIASETATETAEQAEKVSVFTGYPGESIWTLVWFTVLLIALKKFAWKPLLAGLKARQDYIASEITQAEQTRKQAGDRLAQYEKKLAAADEEAKKLAQKHIAAAQGKGDDIVDAAKKEADGIKIRAREDINKAVDAAKKTLWDDAGEMVCSLGSEILGRAITPEDNRKLIDDAVNKFKQVQEAV